MGSRRLGMGVGVVSLCLGVLMLADRSRSASLADAFDVVGLALSLCLATTGAWAVWLHARRNTQRPG